jgi:hypothetical protein
LIDLRALPLSSSVRREPRAVCRPREAPRATDRTCKPQSTDAAHSRKHQGRRLGMAIHLGSVAFGRTGKVRL